MLGSLVKANAKHVDRLLCIKISYVRDKRKLDKFVVVPKKEAERLLKEGNYKVFFDGEEYFLAKKKNFDKDSVLCRYVLYSLEE